MELNFPTFQLIYLQSILMEMIAEIHSPTIEIAYSADGDLCQNACEGYGSMNAVYQNREICLLWSSGSAYHHAYSKLPVDSCYCISTARVIFASFFKFSPYSGDRIYIWVHVDATSMELLDEFEHRC